MVQKKSPLNVGGHPDPDLGILEGIFTAAICGNGIGLLEMVKDPRSGFSSSPKIRMGTQTERFVVSHPLCFLLNKFGKTQSKLLKSALVDFYIPEDLSSAKIQLLMDTGEILSVCFPHVPQQRQGDNRAVRDVDDMFTILTTLDEAENVICATYIGIRQPRQYPLYQTV